MGVRLRSRWARGPAQAGIDPAKKPARDTRQLESCVALSERATEGMLTPSEIVASGLSARRAARRNRNVLVIHEDSEHRATQQSNRAVDLWGRNGN